MNFRSLMTDLIKILESYVIFQAGHIIFIAETSNENTKNIIMLTEKLEKYHEDKMKERSAEVKEAMK